MIEKIKTIGIDARFYGPANKGLGRYTKEIVDGVVNSDKNNKFVIFLCKENYHKFKTNNIRVKKVLADVRWYSFAEQILMPYYVWREKVNLMHWTHFNVPFFCTFQKFIVTIHDLILIKFPTKRATTLSPLIYKIKNKCYKIIIKRAVKKSKKIITISKHAKEDIKQQFKIKEDKIIVIYEGVSNILKQDIQYDKKSILRYNINNPFILYVGNAYPHKNLEGLINVFEKIKQTNNSLLLVLVGKEDYFYKQIKEKAKKSKYSKDIIFPGFVPDKDLINFFKLALVYVFPSFYEGFGLPPLEAMQNGCPVVSSNKTCLPEILGNAVEYFNPENKNEMIEKINKLINNINLRKQLINNGYERVKKYDWNKCIKETLKIYYNIFL